MPQEARLKLYNNAMKVRIKSLGLPKAAYGQQVDYGLSLGRGMEGDPSGSLKPKRTIGGVPREEANLEAEGGETVVGQISGDGIVDHMIIKGPRHSSGGVPMNLPDDSFIFSDTASMKIKDPQILQMFGKSKGSYTPAELAKPYDISKYKAILMDPDTDRLSRNTAEIMIKNIVMKLGALALAQEAKKGFPQGVPEIAKPYMEVNGISEEDLMPELKAQAEQMQAMQQQEAMQMQQAQGMQQPQMQQQGPPQGMPPMMPDGQPVAMPQQGMAPPQQPMMDPNQMMAMQQEQQMMPPQPQQGMPMAAYGMQLGGYDMPFVMGTGGMMSYHNGGTGPGHPHKKGTQTIIVKNKDGSTTEIQADPAEKLTLENRAQTTEGLEGAYEIKTEKVAGQEGDAIEAANTTRMASTPAEVEAWKNGLCERMKPGGDLHGSKPEAVAKEHFGRYWEANVQFLKDCHGEAEIFEDTEKTTTVGQYVDKTTEESCQCKDKDGNPIEGLVVKVSEIPEGIECGTQEFNEMFCVENAEEIIEKRKQDGLALGSIKPIFETNVPGQDKASIVTANVQGNTIDYKTMVQQLQGKADDAKQKNTRGLNYAQTAAMDSFIDGQVMDKEIGAINKVYIDNAKTANDLEKLQLQKDLGLAKTQAQIDMAYNQSEGAREAQQVLNRNQNRNFRYNANRKDRVDALQYAAIDALGPNFNLAGQYLQNGVPINANVNMNTNDAVMTQYNTYMQANCGGKDSAACRKKFADSIKQASGNIPDGTVASKFGGSSTPYIMASSVYPFIT